MVSTILHKLAAMQNVQTYAETLQSLLHYAQHHLALIATTLLAQPLPFEQCVPLIVCNRGGILMAAVVLHQQRAVMHKQDDG